MEALAEKAILPFFDFLEMKIDEPRLMSLVEKREANPGELEGINDARLPQSMRIEPAEFEISQLHIALISINIIASLLTHHCVAANFA